MLTISLETPRRVGFVDITGRVEDACERLGVVTGALVVYVPHTTAGVTINENADPSVRADLESALQRLVPEDSPFTHLEGNADAHVKASLVGSSVTIPVSDGRLCLGTWQGVYFAEFDGPRRRRVHVVGLSAVAA
ncbi:MAG TPA: secondary thiamine-phosphate synthase enzyme YjbQ [Thermoleophilia bacterium]|nr:secondary thiamine-phosphate synthase enzyme YjbQ [Thermoleophilia bacterium]HQG03909.1 secondary thiamine-phosphate synthase enzyme YjbQ [Thermoleophilia bacterium]HQG54999.1 secondary thiamine-phosphate synthase enzyme YjbQ [Thermoleophilia bacterium]HQJ98333.1 secondary thiamine-phosphate synthase enzyme YjbQ [Thermoleophilia bacterium]